MTKRKIILFSFDYAHLGSGISRLCTEIINGLKRILGDNLQVLTYRLRSEGISALKKDDFQTPETRPWREFSALKYLLKGRRTDRVVLCATWYPEGLISYLASSFPYMILAHGTEILPSRNIMKRPVWNVLKKMVLNNANLIIANSNYTATLTQKYTSSKVIALPLAVDVQRFSPGDKAKCKNEFSVTGKTVITTAARIFRYKGHETVFAAIAKLEPKQKEKLVYLIAGRGPHENSLKRLAKELKIDDCIRFLGVVGENQLPNLYRATDLFCLCSWEEYENQNVEGFGLVFLEAQACGTPVVGTRSGGIPDAISVSEGGLLIDERDSNALAAIISEVIEQPEKYEKIGLQLRKHVAQNCTWDKYVSKLLENLEKNIHNKV